MEDISTLIWLGVVVVWFLTRLVRRGVKKAVQPRQETKRPTVSRPPARPGGPPTEPQRSRFGERQDFSGRGGAGPPPIEPR